MAMVLRTVGCEVLPSGLNLPSLDLGTSPEIHHSMSHTFPKVCFGMARNGFALQLAFQDYFVGTTKTEHHPCVDGSM